MIAAGAADEVRAADAAGASATARKALGFEELLAGDVEAMQRNTRRYAKRQLTWMRKLPDVRLVDVTDRAPGDVAAELHGMIRLVRFEKWQALGNDYLIVERANLPEPLTPEFVRRLCDPHFGPGADGVLELSPPDEPGFVARMRIFNPDGSEAEISGNGAREAILYLRHRGWTEADTFSIQTARRRDPPDDHRADDVPRRHGPRVADLQGLPGRPARRDAARSPATPSSTSRSATRSARSGSRTATRSNSSSWTGSACRSSTPTCSRTARTRRSGPSSARTRSARGSSSAASARRCRRAPARAAPPSPTCCAAATRR